MHKFLLISLSLLGGCALTQQAPDINGLWINQAAIDTAAQGQPLLNTLNAHGMNFEWYIDTRTGRAQASNAFESGEGQLRATTSGLWVVDYDGYGTDELRLDGDQLIQQTKASVAGQTFRRPAQPATAEEKWGATFRRALNSAYLGGQWKIVEGQGVGDAVVFEPDGRISGLASNDRYELCLGGDCASQGAGNDIIYLGKGDEVNAWVFVRYGNQLEILEAINHSGPEEIPHLAAGPRQWLLERQSVTSRD